MSSARALVLAALGTGLLYVIGIVALGSAPDASDAPPPVLAWFRDHQDAARTYAWTSALGTLTFAVMAGIIAGCCRGRWATYS